MKKLPVLMIGAVLLTCFASASRAQEWSAAQKELWGTELKSWDALKAMDADGFLKFCHEDYQNWYTPQPFPFHKNEVKEGLINEWKTSKPIGMTLRPLGIILNGNVGVTHYYIISTNNDPSGKQTTTVERWTDTWIKEDGKWLLLADHGGPDERKTPQP